MPVASAAAAVLGAILLFWRRFVALLRSGAERIASLFRRR